MDYEVLEMPEAGDRVVVGLSGGVDSTLTALMLKERGCEVIGVTMSLWDGSLPEIKSGRPAREACFGPGEEESIEECRKFCGALGIDYHVIGVQEAYKKNVLDYFKAEYRAGRTPNPCVRCNLHIKFGALLDGLSGLGIGYDYFCTGHYAKIVRPREGIFGTDARPCMIATAADMAKDQTYFIHRIPSDVLEKVRFPLSSMRKSEVLARAREAGLAAAYKEESQDFISGEYFDILFSDRPSVPGDIIDLDGHVLGRHRGIERYTIGQRRGLGVALSYPAYVQAIDARSNVVVLAPSGALNSGALIADDFSWPSGIEPPEEFEADVKIRLASRPVRATVSRYTPTADDPFHYKGQAWLVTFSEPQRAVAPGQSAVLYIDNVIVGGGVIARALR